MCNAAHAAGFEYFPLTGGDLSSWPDKRFAGSVVGDVAWVDDDVFGNVLYCSKGMLCKPICVQKAS